MNESQPDDIAKNDPVVARLRSALDEVTASAPASATNAARPVVSVGRAPNAARWLAAAAAAVLVVGAATAVIVNRSHRSPASSSPTDVPVTQSPTTVPYPAGTEFWYTLASQDLVPGDIVETPCCASGVGGSPSLSMAWMRDTGLSDGLLTMTEVTDTPGSVSVVVGQGMSVRDIDGGRLVFTSYGITDAERDSLAGQVVAGSGLPYILPAEGWQYVAMGHEGSGAQLMQEYTNDQGSVAITVGDYRTQLADLAGEGSEITPVIVAGNGGWFASDRDGTTLVVWQVHDTDQWATLRIPPAFADRVDGLIAAVQEQTSATEPASSVPAPTDGVSETTASPTDPTVGQLPTFDQTVSAPTDPAVGMAAPAIIGRDLDGKPMTVDFSTPTLLVFVPHWSPYSTTELAVLEAAMADGTIPGDVQVILISTAADDSLDNYPPQQWLADNGWRGGPVFDDSVDRRAAGPVANAFGASGWPFFVAVGSDGLVQQRAVGELAIADVTALLAPTTSAAALGAFDMPTTGVHFAVVDGSGYPNSAALQVGPILVRGQSPDAIGAPLDPSIVVTTRVAFGVGPDTEPNLGQVGDRFTFNSPDGATQAYEIVFTEVCTGADCGTDQLYTLLITFADSPDRIYAKPVA